MTLTIVGLGPGDIDDLLRRAWCVLEKLDFVQEGYFRENFYDPTTEQFSDTAVYSLLKAAWLGRSHD
jgi:RimJ/RimL family protein N-acetyltransferase